MSRNGGKNPVQQSHTEEMEVHVDAEPYAMPSQQSGRGQRGARGRPTTHHTTGASLEDAFNLLPPEERGHVRADVQDALSTAHEALAMVGGPGINLGGSKKGSGPEGRKPPMVNMGIPVSGSVNINNFSHCSNVQIGNNQVTTTHYHGGSDGSDDRTQQPVIDDDIKRLQGSTRLVDSGDVSKLAEHIGSCWRRLGRALELTDGELDNLRHDYDNEGLYEIIYQMIRKWMKKKSDKATVGVIVQALIAVRQPGIARSVFIKK